MRHVRKPPINPQRISAAEFSWQGKQPVIGSPSVPQLRIVLREAGFDRVSLSLHASREDLEFTLWPANDRKDLNGARISRDLIRAFRSAGFDIGFEELLVDSTGDCIKGITITGPIGQVAIKGAPQIEVA